MRGTYTVNEHEATWADTDATYRLYESAAGWAAEAGEGATRAHILPLDELTGSRVLGC